MTKTYKIKRQASGEFKVNCFIDGVHNEDASYYTDDRQDALATIEANERRDREASTPKAYKVASDSTGLGLILSEVFMATAAEVEILESREDFITGESWLVEADPEEAALAAYNRENPEASFNGSKVYEDDLIYFINIFAGLTGKTPAEYLTRLGKLTALHNAQTLVDIFEAVEGGL